MTWDANKVATAGQQQWSVEGWPGYWAAKTGGETSAPTSTAYDGGQLEPEVLGGQRSTSNIVLTRPYRPGRLAALLTAWEKQVGRKTTTVAGYDTDPDLGPIGQPVTYADALVVRIKRVDYQAGSGDPGNIELEVAVSGPA